jgi:hypothetical protein
MAKKLKTYTIDRGTEYSIGYQHQHNGSSYPLTGCTLYFTLKPVEYDSNLTDTSAVAQRTLTTFTDAANGIAQITLTDTETQLDPAITYYADIKVEEPGRVGAIKTFEANFKVDGSPTNRNLSNG